MRLLIIDESGVLPWVIQRLVPLGVDIEWVTSYRQAEQALRAHPPDAAIVSLTPARLPWRSFQSLCATQAPPVPVLYESCVYASPDEAGLTPVEGYAAFLKKPAPKADLQFALERLVDESLRLRESAAL